MDHSHCVLAFADAFRGTADIANVLSNVRLSLKTGFPGRRHILSKFGIKPLACCRALPPSRAAPPYWPGWPSGYRPGFFMATVRVSPLNHHLDAPLIERLPSLVEMTSLGQSGADPS